MITFYGTEECLISWIGIIERDLGKVCGEIVTVAGRPQFDVDLTTEDREYLQTNYWYAKQDGQELAWNYRIAYSEK